MRHENHLDFVPTGRNFDVTKITKVTKINLIMQLIIKLIINLSIIAITILKPS